MKSMMVGSLAMVLFAGAPAGADTVRLYDTGDGTTSGGSFRAETGLRGTFETFCIEGNEYLSYGALYYYTISDAAVNGGLGGGSPDPISDTTRNMYYAFRTGLVAGIIGTSDADAIADAVQGAIWFEEDETTSMSTTATTLRTYFLNTNNYVQGYQSVKVMNVWQNSDFTGNKQDQLIIVPLPHASGLACAGLLGLVSVRRRRA